MKASERTKRKQKRILLAAVNAAEYDTMDTDNNGRISLLEFMCGTLIRQARFVGFDNVKGVHPSSILCWCICRNIWFF